MTTNSQLSTTELKKNNKNKNELSKQLEQEQNHKIEITWKVIRGVWEGGEWEKATGNKKHNCQAQNRQGEVKNSIGNGEIKELICTTHGHELREGNAEGQVGAGQGRMKGGKMGQL